MELAIMNVLGDKGPSTVQAVQARLQGKPEYTTVQTILNTKFDITFFAGITGRS
jgi:predicted transcriptional regulator